MRTIIAGSRHITSAKTVERAITDSGFAITRILSGGARGVDSLGEQYAAAHHIPVERFSPQWGLYGKAAGPMRNRAMALHADALIAIWDGKSRGTKDMIAVANERGLQIHVHLVTDDGVFYGEEGR